MTGGVAGGAVVGGALATTGFDVMLFVVVSMALLLLGTVALRAAIVQRARTRS